MPTQSCENCSATDDNFYEKLTSLKQQNIFHLQQLENELYNTDPRYGDGGMYKRSGSARSDTSAKRWCKMSFVYWIQNLYFTLFCQFEFKITLFWIMSNSTKVAHWNSKEEKKISISLLTGWWKNLQQIFFEKLK